ncbi:MAG: exonuclease domain-containing protein [Clostridia bacterium]|nr:exonuclease domain-containing protein [Clostridia bacterium]
MQYIVLDLEWNQPINYQNRIYRLYGDRLVFEMIQIGAVRIDENLNILDSISIPIQPTCYTVIHPRIRSMTHLSTDTLSDAPYFEEAMEQFVSWCGEDYVLLTWGCDDVSVLQQNLDFFEIHPDLPTLYDIQPLFVKEFSLNNRMGLKSAMELMNIAPDDDRYFHNAQYDAYYTALVFTHLKNPQDVLSYPQKPKPLFHQEAAVKPRKGDLFESIEKGLESIQATSPYCTVCGKPCTLDGRYIPQSRDRLIGLAKCQKHGTMLVRVTFRTAPDGMYTMQVKTAKASRSNIAYIHTKQFQMQETPDQPSAEGGQSIPTATLDASLL